MDVDGAGVRRPRARVGRVRGIRARLVGLVLVPTLALAGVGFGEIGDQRLVADHAARLAAGVSDAAVALDASVGIWDLYRLTELRWEAERLGLEPAAAAALVGIDLTGELRDIRRQVDANPAGAALLRRHPRAAAVLDGAAAPPAEARALLSELSVAAEQQWSDAMERLFASEGGRSIDHELHRALDALSGSAEVLQSGSDELRLAFEVVRPVRDAASTRAELEQVWARHGVAREQVVVAGGPTVRAALASMEDNRFGALLHEALGAAPVADVDTLTELFDAGLQRDTDLRRLTDVASDAAHRQALRVGQLAEERYERTVLIVLAVLVAAIGGALAVAQSISRPLRRLADRAAELSEGVLDGPPLREAGPREAAVLARALNDAVANLRAVEAQMAALATGEVAADDRTGPGKLGDLVGRSVERLSRSLTERERLQARLAHDAAHDALTGLANRRTAITQLNAWLAEGARVGLLFLDLDSFKTVNDEQGHAAGDQILRVTAARLRATVRADALVARLGGDEFVVATICGPEAERDIAALAERVRERVNQPVSIDGTPHRIGVSVGVALSVPGEDGDRLLRSADTALYEAKRSARGSVVAFDAQLRAVTERQHEVEVGLRRALVEDHLELHYQPVFEAGGGELRGAEALVRWRTEQGELVMPDRFVPVAERSELIVAVDHWVLDHGLAQLGRWQRDALPGLTLSVNMSAKTLLSHDLVAQVQAALARHGVDGSTLVVEVTETALLHDLEVAADHIGRLLALGIRTSVDDFGTGYTSVSHLRRLPVSEVKIDRSFVQAMVEDDRDRVLVDLVARIANVLSLDVVAEGVETHEQLAALRLLGCRFAQGYLLGRPMPADDLLRTHGGVEADAAGSGAAVAAPVGRAAP